MIAKRSRSSLALRRELRKNGVRWVGEGSSVDAAALKLLVVV
jgi:hypothetical protein